MFVVWVETTKKKLNLNCRVVDVEGFAQFLIRFHVDFMHCKMQTITQTAAQKDFDYSDFIR